VTREEAQKALYAAEDAARRVRNIAKHRWAADPADIAKLADAVASGFQAIHVLLKVQ